MHAPKFIVFWQLVYVPAVRRVLIIFYSRASEKMNMYLVVFFELKPLVYSMKSPSDQKGLKTALVVSQISTFAALPDASFLSFRLMAAVSECQLCNTS